mmetsp:Transcript_92859/g.298705  ORF Transcript_92859/g.298705 Transcript_92859/m.298705 type:complete len:291 (-) Transcript_92859:941-1813(-)
MLLRRIGSGVPHANLERVHLSWQQRAADLDLRARELCGAQGGNRRAHEALPIVARADRLGAQRRGPSPGADELLPPREALPVGVVVVAEVRDLTPQLEVKVVRRIQDDIAHLIHEMHRREKNIQVVLSSDFKRRWLHGLSTEGADDRNIPGPSDVTLLGLQGDEPHNRAQHLALCPDVADRPDVGGVVAPEGKARIVHPELHIEILPRVHHGIPVQRVGAIVAIRCPNPVVQGLVEVVHVAVSVFVAREELLRACRVRASLPIHEALVAKGQDQLKERIWHDLGGGRGAR